MNFLDKMERKYGRYALSHLTMYIIVTYIAGYIIALAAPIMRQYLTLEPYYILHGQIWRLVSWILIPPSSLDIFTIIMLFFYYSIGTSLERAWGDFKYNVYIFSGILMTILGSFLLYGIEYAVKGYPRNVYADTVQGGQLLAKHRSVLGRGEPAVLFLFFVELTDIFHGSADDTDQLWIYDVVRFINLFLCYFYGRSIEYRVVEFLGIFENGCVFSCFYILNDLLHGSLVRSVLCRASFQHILQNIFCSLFCQFYDSHTSAPFRS